MRISLLRSKFTGTADIMSIDCTDGHRSQNVSEQTNLTDSGAEKLASASSNSNACTVCVHDHGSNGKTGYLGGQYMAHSGYNTTNLRSGVEDQLIEQMVYWLAN